MKTADKLLGLFGSIDEALALSFKGGGNRYQAWLDAIQSRYNRVTGEYVGEFDFKASGKDGFILIFEKCVFAGTYSSASTSRLTHAAKAAGIGKRNHGRWKIDHANNLVAGSGLVIQPFPDDIRNLKSLMAHLEDDDGIQDGTKFDTKPSVSASQPESATLAALGSITPPAHQSPEDIYYEVAKYVAEHWTDSLDRDGIDVQVSKYQDVMDLNFELRFKRNTAIGAYTENESKIKRGNLMLHSVEKLLKGNGLRPEVRMCTPESSAARDDRSVSNGRSAYSEYEQSIGGSLRVRM